MELKTDKLTYAVNPDGTAGALKSIAWTATDTQDAIAVSVFGDTAIPSGHPAESVPYEDITEAQCETWVLEIEDQASIQAALDNKMADATNTSTGEGLPWVANYPHWVVGVAYVLGDVVQYEKQAYEVIQAHTSSAEWPPSITPALFTVYVPPEAGPQPWVQPTGAHDAYQLGDQVTHVGSTWESDVNDNVWEPGVSGWSVIS